MSFNIAWTVKIIDQYTAVTKKIIRSAEELTEKMTKLSRGFYATSRFGRELSRMGTDLTKKFSLIGGAVTGVAIHTAAEYYNSMDKIKIITGATEEQMNNLADVNERLSKTTLSTKDDLAKAEIVMYQRGVKTVEQMDKILSSATRLNIALGTDLTNGVNISMSAMNLWNKSYDDLPNITNRLIAAASKSGASAQDFNEAWKEGAAVAKKAGYNMEEYTSDLAYYVRIQGSAEGAASSMNIMIKTLSLALEKQGIHTGKLKSLSDIIDVVNKKHMSQGEMYKTFGRSTVFLTRMMNDTDGLKNFNKELEKSGEISQQLVELQYGDLNNQLKRLHQAYQNLELAIIKPDMINKLNIVMNWIIGLINEISEGSPVLFSFIKWIALIAMVIGPTLIALGHFYMGFVLLEKLKVIVGILKLFGFTIAGIVSPIGLAVTGVLALSLGFYELYKHCKVFHDFVDRLIAKMATLTNALGITATTTAIVKGKSVSTTSFNPMTPMTGMSIATAPVNPIGSLIMMLAQHFSKPQQIAVDINVNDKNNVVGSVHTKSPNNALTSSVQRGNNMPQVGAF